MRNTKQRDLVFDVVSKSYDHLSATEVYEKCREVISDISLGTVYRNLNTLESLGKIRRIKMLDNIDRFDRFDQHAHFICLECGDITDIMDFNLEKTFIGSNKVVDYEINFKGICYKCLEREGEI